MTARRGIVLIGQSDFNGARRSKDRRNGLAGNALVTGANSHHGDEVHFECKVFQGGANPHMPNTAVAHLIREPCAPGGRYFLDRHQTMRESIGVGPVPRPKNERILEE